MKKTFLSLASAALLAVTTSASAVMTLTVTDLNDLSFETYTDGATPGAIFLAGGASTIMSTYWAISSQIDISSENIDTPGFLTTASLDLFALATGTNVGLSLTSDNYTNPVAGSYEFTSTSNASSAAGAFYSVETLIDGVALLDAVIISDTVTTETATKAFAIGSPYSIAHNLELTATTPFGVLAFDATTSAGEAVPAPAPLALVALGLVGLGVTRKLRGA